MSDDNKNKNKNKNKEEEDMPLVDVFGNRYKIAPESEMRNLQSEFEVFERAMDIIAGVSGILCTDESALYDFPIEDEDITKLSELLDVEINENDLIIDILRKLKAKT